MIDYDPTWRSHAKYLVRKLGYASAIKSEQSYVEDNHPGTFSHTFHVAVLKMLKELQAAEAKEAALRG
jgi:hypothetical protein